MRRAILLIAYGPSSMQGRAALGTFDARVRQLFPGLPVRWAYSSLLMRRRLAEARQKSDSVAKALQRLRLEKFSSVAVQPLQTICGAEYAQVRLAAEEAQKFLHITIQPEKDVVLILVPAAGRQPVMKAICAEGAGAGHALAFSLPVSDVTGLSLAPFGAAEQKEGEDEKQ